MLGGLAPLFAVGFVSAAAAGAGRGGHTDLTPDP